MDIPLHPMLVHLPLGLAIVLPFAVGALLWRARFAAEPGAAWRPAVALFLVLALAATAAVLSGHRDEEVVEGVVREAALETHEDRADAFLWLAWAGVAASAVGLFRGAAGRLARPLAGVLSLLLFAGAFYVGHAGGVLVYSEGAAQVHVAAGGDAGARGGGGALERDDDD